MIWRVLLSASIASLSLILIYSYCQNHEEIPEFYANNIRSSLFSGFLTVGSFLLSLKVFIVVKLKENIFDTDGYKEKLKVGRKINPKLTLYGPVKRLSSLLFLTISSAMVASVTQLTIGLIPFLWAAFFCIFVSVFAVSMLIFTLLLIREILSEWLNYLEQTNDT